MSSALSSLTAHLLTRLGQVRQQLGGEPLADDASLRFADVIDSMGMVEFLALTAGDCGVTAEVIEQAAGRRFGTVAELAEAARQLAAAHGLLLADLGAVVIHGGNGRMAALLARQLGLPVERVWNETARTGNLGSASLPVAWAARTADEQRPVVWTAVGAGLQWGAALFGPGIQT